MKRRLFTAASAVSLLVCLACGGLFARSQFRTDYVRRETPFSITEFSSKGGVLMIGRLPPNPSRADFFAHRERILNDPELRYLLDDPMMRRELADTPRWEWSSGAAGPGYRSWGGDTYRFEQHPLLRNFDVRVATKLDGGDYSESGKWLFFPIWEVIAVTFLLPVIWAMGFVKRRNCVTLGTCPTCSYILTGNASGVCPECGTAVRSKTD